MPTATATVSVRRIALHTRGGGADPFRDAQDYVVRQASAALDAAEKATPGALLLPEHAAWIPLIAKNGRIKESEAALDGDRSKEILNSTLRPMYRTYGLSVSAAVHWDERIPTALNFRAIAILAGRESINLEAFIKS